MTVVKASARQQASTEVRDLNGEAAIINELQDVMARGREHNFDELAVLYVVRLRAMSSQLARVIHRLAHLWSYQRIALVLDSCTEDDAMSCFAAGADEILIAPLNETLLGAHILAQTRSLTQMLELHAENVSLKNRVHALQSIAYHDPVTGIPNRQAFERALQREGSRHRRDRLPLGLVICDIDHFKQYNDAYGHPAGDAALRRVANALEGVLHRETDIVSRYGGEEFAALLSNTDRTGVDQVAEYMRSAVAALKIPHRDSPTAPVLTICCGAACNVPDTLTSLPTLVEAADRALYLAKNAGRNCVAYEDTSLTEVRKIGGPSSHSASSYRGLAVHQAR